MWPPHGHTPHNSHWFRSDTTRKAPPLSFCLPQVNSLAQPSCPHSASLLFPPAGPAAAAAAPSTFSTAPWATTHRPPTHRAQCLHPAGHSCPTANWVFLTVFVFTPLFPQIFFYINVSIKHTCMKTLENYQYWYQSLITLLVAHSHSDTRVVGKGRAYQKQKGQTTRNTWRHSLRKR